MRALPLLLLLAVVATTPQAALGSPAIAGTPEVGALLRVQGVAAMVRWQSCLRVDCRRWQTVGWERTYRVRPIDAGRLLRARVTSRTGAVRHLRAGGVVLPARGSVIDRPLPWGEDADLVEVEDAQILARWRVRIIDRREGGDGVSLYVHLVNTGSGVQIGGAADLALIDADGAIDPLSAAAGGLPDLVELAPGQGASGWVHFAGAGSVLWANVSIDPAAGRFLAAVPGG